MTGAESPTEPEPAAALRALWLLATHQPHLLVAHAAGYGTLVREEGTRSLAMLGRRALLIAVAFGALFAAATLAGVAILMWATAPAGSLVLPWVLIVVPAAPLLVAAGALLGARRGGPLPLWSEWRRQVAADSEMINRHYAP